MAAATTNAETSDFISPSPELSMFKAAPLWPGRSLVRECARFGRVTPIERLLNLSFDALSRSQYRDRELRGAAGHFAGHGPFLRRWCGLSDRSSLRTQHERDRMMQDRYDYR
jgi:hypothetical protein